MTFFHTHTLNTTSLSSQELERYSRHLLLPEVGLAGQQRLKAARVLVVGAGGLGSPAALYLAAAGVGTLGIADGDTLELSNLQRQILHTTSGIGQNKALLAEKHLHALNPHITLTTHQTVVTCDNAVELIQPYDVIIDGTDNFATRYLLNDACGLARKPLVYGSVFRFAGQVSIFDAERGGCYRCLYPTPPPPELAPNCAEGGVLGVLAGIVGTLQAAEALKIVLGIGETLHRRLLLVDALTMNFTTLTLPRNPYCALCGEAPSIHDLQDYDAFCNPSTAAEQSTALDLLPFEISARELQSEVGNYLIIDVREAHERIISAIEGSLHIPLGELENRLEEIAAETKPILFYCQSGKRSAQALLKAFSHNIKAKHLRGGINAWLAQSR